MAVALAVFVLVSGAIMGGYVLLTKLPGFTAGRRLERRLRDLGRPDDASGPVLVNVVSGSGMPGVERLVRGTQAGASLSVLIEQAGVRTTTGAVVTTSVVLALGLGLLAFLFLHRAAAVVVAAMLGLCLPILVLKVRRSRRLKRFEEQFPEALDLLARSLKAGHAFQAGMGMVADELPDPVGTEFRRSFDQQNFGLPLKEALNQMAERVPLMDVRFFVTAVQIQRETGGNLAEILENLAQVVRERFKILRQVRVHTAHGRFTAFVLLALSPALAIVMSVISPEHIKTLVESQMGRTMILGAIVMQTIGFFWIRKVIKIEV
jgi:tight adherence protein B